MDWQIFENVKLEKQKALIKYNRFRTLKNLRQIIELVVFIALVCWYSARAPAILSACLFNHHVVFLIGNAIILSLFVLFRQNDVVLESGDVDFYDEYFKYSRRREVAVVTTKIGRETGEEEGGNDQEKVVDDVALVIERAERRIRRFERTQSEKLRREIKAVRRRKEMRRSETETRKRDDETDTTKEAEIEKLSNEEFRRTVDDFIDRHWGKKKTFLLNGNNNVDENMRITNY